MAKHYSRGISQQLYRLKTLSPNFWKNVIVQNQELKNYIVEWLLALKYYRNISLTTFSELFSKCQEIKFPIKISGFRRYLQIIDSSSKSYYMRYIDYDYHKLNKYVLGSRANGFDTSFSFNLNDNSQVILDELCFLQLNEANNNTDKSVSFSYNSNTKITTAVLQSGKTLHLEMSYPELDQKLDELLSDYLFSLTEKFIYIDDVLFVLEYMYITLIPFTDKYSLQICSYDGFEEDKQILSEIRLLDGIVTKYSFTTRTDCKICLEQLFPYEELKKFILSKKNRVS